jgi:hypothetical protein
MSGSSGRKAAVAVMDYLNNAQDESDLRTLKSTRNAISALRSGYTSAKSHYGDAKDLFNPYAEAGLEALGGYTDAIGMNGAEGNDRAVASFRAGPGYQWAVDQATDAVARKQGAIGALGSGNTMAAISDRAGHMADQEYDDYLDRLNGVVGLGYNATTAQAGIEKGIGDLGMTYGAGKAAIHGDRMRLDASTAANTAGQYASALQGGMMAGENAAANRWGLGMNLLSGGASFLGGGGLGQIKKLFA